LLVTRTTRVGWRYAFDSGYVQSLNYVGRALSLDLEYLLTSSISGIESQRLRGAMKYGF
jgi:hypothetical protein